jgi:hypothetical protein
MRKSITSTILTLSLFAVSTPGYAATASTTGTIGFLAVYANIEDPAETVLFELSNGATITTMCSNAGSNTPTFSFVPADISDAQTRKNMLTMLFAARTSGLPITVNFDNAGAHCDSQFGFAIPLVIGM